MVTIKSNEEIEDIIKRVQSFEDSGILIKGVTQTIENKPKEQKGVYLGMFRHD